MELLMFRAPLLLRTSALLLMILHQVSAVRYMVGGNTGWTTNVNYSVWAQGKHFYLGDWLFFDYDRNQMNVLEVNKTDYETCNSDHPLVDWTRGSGRDLIPLNVTKHYYIISGKGFCYGGMKLAINVENPPPSPSPSPLQSRSSRIPFRAQIAMPIALAVAAVWDFLLRSL